MSSARNARASQVPNYERHRPEQTLLYQLVQQHYPVFKSSLDDQGQSLPRYVQREFEDFLQCGRLEYGFCVCAVKIVITSVWSLSAANGVVSAPAAVPAGWWRVPHFGG
uniref:ISCR1 n=1 Tax=Acinetobacter baumannii TaxID=470 RepID=A0A6B7HJD4_ACIBA|nr:ISCR1 [Acinetobacter baumannii]